jgi:hypothetical protein
MGGHKGGKKKGGKKKVGRRDGKEATGNQPARGNQQRLPSVRQQLASQDPPCTVHEMEADGNCLFRSLHDQLVGVVPGLDYRTLRATLLDYVEREAAFYASFVEDDETIDEYIARMREDGSWGGHIELHACARRYGVNVCVSQSNSPRWCIKEWPEDVMMLHITYHDGNHYNSVRTKDGAIARSMADGRAPMGVEPGGEDREPPEAFDREAFDREACNPAGASEDESNGSSSPLAPISQSSAPRKGNCPCGSGRKYRKCCKKRESRRREDVEGKLVSQVASLDLSLESIDI